MTLYQATQGFSTRGKDPSFRKREGSFPLDPLSPKETVLPRPPPGGGGGRGGDGAERGRRGGGKNGETETGAGRRGVTFFRIVWKGYKISASNPMKKSFLEFCHAEKTFWQKKKERVRRGGADGDSGACRRFARDCGRACFRGAQRGGGGQPVYLRRGDYADRRRFHRGQHVYASIRRPSPKKSTRTSILPATASGAIFPTACSSTSPSISPWPQQTGWVRSSCSGRTAW